MLGLHHSLWLSRGTEDLPCLLRDLNKIFEGIILKKNLRQFNIKDFALPGNCNILPCLWITGKCGTEKVVQCNLLVVQYTVYPEYQLKIFKEFLLKYSRNTTRNRTKLISRQAFRDPMRIKEKNQTYNSFVF